MEKNETEEDTIFSEKFVRWQGRQIDQLGFVNNLFIVLATGVLAFQTDLVFNSIQKPVNNTFILLFSIFIMLFSILVGCVLAINRLNDFRKTLDIVKAKRKLVDFRSKDEKSNIKKLKSEEEKLGENTWKLLNAQIISFSLSLISFSLSILVLVSFSVNHLIVLRIFNFITMLIILIIIFILSYQIFIKKKKT